MKKIVTILVLVLVLAACGASIPETTVPATTAPAETTTPAQTLETEALLNELYEHVTVELMLTTETMQTSLSDVEMFTWLTGLESNEGVVDASVSLPMMGSRAYHVVLVRAESNEKAAELAQYLYDNANMARWVCVQATEKAAVVCGDLALFVMLDPQYGVTSEQIVDGFTTVCGGTADTVIK